jgi:hypothetical protein
MDGNPERRRRVTKGYSGGIWTNRIDRIAPMARPQGRYSRNLAPTRRAAAARWLIG